MLEYKGGIMDGEPLDPEEFGAIARLPGLDVLHGQLVGLAASPLTGLARGLAAMISGLAVALGQIAEQGLVGGGDEPAAAEAPAAEEAKAEEPQAEAEAEEPAEEPEAEEPAAEEEPEAEVKAEEKAPETSKRKRNRRGSRGIRGRRGRFRGLGRSRRRNSQWQQQRKRCPPRSGSRS